MPPRSGACGARLPCPQPTAALQHIACNAVASRCGACAGGGSGRRAKRGQSQGAKANAKVRLSEGLVPTAGSASCSGVSVASQGCPETTHARLSARLLVCCVAGQDDETACHCALRVERRCGGSDAPAPHNSAVCNKCGLVAVPALSGTTHRAGAGDFGLGPGRAGGQSPAVLVRCIPAVGSEWQATHTQPGAGRGRRAYAYRGIRQNVTVGAKLRLCEEED